MAFFKSIVVLCMAMAVTSAQVLDCTEYVGRQMTLELDGQTIEYSGIEVYFKYDNEHVNIYQHPGKSSANLELENTGVIFRGLAVKDGAINDKYSFKAEKIFSTKTIGFANNVKNHGNSKKLSGCSFVVTKSSSAFDIWPKTLTDKLVSKVGECLREELCSAL